MLKQKYTVQVLRGSDFNDETKLGQSCLAALGVRIRGYFVEYGVKAMPLDIYDHFSDQLLLFRQNEKKSEPIACIRFVSLMSCKKNGVDFLPLTRISTGKPNPRLSMALEEKVKQAKSDLVYNSSLTISPNLKSIREKQSAVKTILGLALNYHKEESNEGFLASAALSVGTEKMFLKIGFNHICKNPSYELQSLNNRENVLLVHDSKTKTYQDLIDFTKQIWEGREELIADI